MKVIRVSIRQGESGLFYATSPDVRELFVGGETEEEARKATQVVLNEISAKLPPQGYTIEWLDE